MGSDRSKRAKQRQVRAARRRLQPIRGARGRSLKHARLNAPRVVGLNQFAQGLAGPRPRLTSRSRVKTGILSALPVVVVVIWVVARVARHL